MNKLMIPVVLAATGMLAAPAWSQAPAAAPALQNNRYFTMPLEKDPTREVGLQSVTMPPGAGNTFHRHPGDQWTAVQEGEVTFTVKGQPPKVLKVGAAPPASSPAERKRRGDAHLTGFGVRAVFRALDL